jgi:hypothetical protein
MSQGKGTFWQVRLSLPLQFGAALIVLRRLPDRFEPPTSEFQMRGVSVRHLVDFALSLYPSDCPLKSGNGVDARVHQIVTHLVEEQISYPECLRASLSLTGTCQPIEKLYEILTLPNEPIPYDGGQGNPHDENSRKKTRTWSPYEDARLVGGIYRFGPDNWTMISRFVGNGRTRSQCTQRWQRGLDPRLSKDQWSQAEELYLRQLVQCYGEKNWTQIASAMGNRSDVQCRYHFKQMQKDKTPQPERSPESTGCSIQTCTPPTEPTVTPSSDVQTAHTAHLGIVRGSDSVPARRAPKSVPSPVEPVGLEIFEKADESTVREENDWADWY